MGCNYLSEMYEDQGRGVVGFKTVSCIQKKEKQWGNKVCQHKLQLDIRITSLILNLKSVHVSEILDTLNFSLGASARRSERRHNISQPYVTLT